MALPFIIFRRLSPQSRCITPAVDALKAKQASGATMTKPQQEKLAAEAQLRAGTYRFEEVRGSGEHTHEA